MEILVNLLKKYLSENFALYLKTLNFHWNVEGPRFIQLHNFFQDIYENLEDATDEIAEHIRSLDSYVPGSFSRYSELSEIKDEVNILSAEEMIKKIQEDNEIILKTLNLTFQLAEKENKQGLIDFLGSRIAQHDKWNWMFKSLMK